MPATPEWPPRSAPRLFVEQTVELDCQLRISGNQAHYLSRVMRVSEGDTIIVCDDETGEWATRVVETGKREIILDPVEKLREREPVPDLWLCPALLKKDRFDLVLEKATELGVARIAPIITRRCVADKLNAERARNIVTEAAEQCARTALPQIDEPVKLDNFLRNLPANRVLFFADELMSGEGAVSAAHVFASNPPPAAILIGPEGGFDDAERDLIRSHHQAKAVALGPRILRGETAAIAAIALWMGVMGDWRAQD
ncbi:16S rRNA (uracil(1498)-N(3))-methyltransferase [Aurantiacibacter marinus]|uniref:Ribosomal RNA small subunit methyltransferase E n=1 Tax=Aurantiacibacter marinus TaxID=874156 RepID=A0A0H0XLK6_9SPHN|nr:16S rRNA (uracil(1498)-N(3))-methyltransferase [Aurantiacibacter marinus]KLI63473.1 16S rRNA methyltransferase [Aurantiacibacter marinus]